MGYELRQRLPGPHDSWLAVDQASGREVLAHRMGDPAASDLLPLVMQVLIGKNESVRATVLDFIQQDGAWLLVTVDSPAHREIRQWLQGTGPRQAAAAPPIDPIAMTRMFRGADPAPAAQAGAYTQLFSPPGSPAPEEPGMGEFTRFFATVPAPNAGDRTKLYSAVETTPAPVEAQPPSEQPTQFFATAPVQPAAEEVTQRFPAQPATPSPTPSAGAFTQYFATGPEQPPTEEATQKFAATPEPPLAVQAAGAFTQYFATGPEQPPTEEATQKFAAPPEPPLAVQAAGAFTQYFTTGPEQPPTEEATQKFVAPPAAPPPVQSAGEFTQYFASGPEQPRAAAGKPSPAPAGAGEFTRMFNSANPAPARPATNSPAGLTGMFGEGASPAPTPAAPSGEGATGFFDSPAAKSAAPPAAVVASDFTRMLQSVPAEPAPAAKPAAEGKEKPAVKAFPIWALFAGVLLLAIALVAGVLLVK